MLWCFEGCFHGPKRFSSSEKCLYGWTRLGLTRETNWGNAVTPVYHRFLSRGDRVNAIAAITSSGLLTVELTKAIVNRDDLPYYNIVRSFDDVSPHSIHIMDNCTVHHVQGSLACLAPPWLFFFHVYMPCLTCIHVHVYTFLGFLVFLRMKSTMPALPFGGRTSTRPPRPSLSPVLQGPPSPPPTPLVDPVPFQLVQDLSQLAQVQLFLQLFLLVIS